MNAEEVAQRLATARPGYQLVSYREVALPLFKIDLDLLVLEKKQLPPSKNLSCEPLSAGLPIPAASQACSA